MLFVISSRRRDTAASELPLAPYQRLFADAPATLQRDYRELREGFAEAARLRVKSGAWPEPAALAADGIPPFASDGVDGHVRDWMVVHPGDDPRTILYIGAPVSAAAGSTPRPELLLQVFEAAPGDLEGADPRTPLDEEHQRLADGTLVHVTTWFRDTLATTPPIQTAGAFRPEMAGFTQLIARARSRPVPAPGN